MGNHRCVLSTGECLLLIQHVDYKVRSKSVLGSKCCHVPTLPGAWIFAPNSSVMGEWHRVPVAGCASLWISVLEPSGEIETGLVFTEARGNGVLEISMGIGESPLKNLTEGKIRLLKRFFKKFKLLVTQGMEQKRGQWKPLSNIVQVWAEHNGNW